MPYSGLLKTLTRLTAEVSVVYQAVVLNCHCAIGKFDKPLGGGKKVNPELVSRFAHE